MAQEIKLYIRKFEKKEKYSYILKPNATPIFKKKINKSHTICTLLMPNAAATSIVSGANGTRDPYGR